jgi:ketosteroid isomerase-like protein
MEWIPGTTTSLLMAEKPFPAAPRRNDGRWEGGGQPISEEQAVPLPEALAAAERNRTMAVSAVAAAEADNTLTPEERVMIPGPESGTGASPDAAAGDPPSARTAAKAGNGTPAPPLDHVEDPRLGKMAAPPQAAALRASNAAADPERRPEETTPHPPEPPAASQAGVELPPALPSQRLAAGPSAQKADQTTGLSSAAAPETSSAPDGETILRERIENWRKAWQQGNLEQYCRFYATQATQDKRTSAEAIRRHKRALWSRAAPARVDLTDIRIALDGNTATAAMRQKYSDTLGRGDRGIKILVWEQSDHIWRIIEETWSPDP